MKIFTAILIVGCLQVSAKGLSQTISLSMKNASMESVFKEVEKRSGYVFFFNSEWMKRAKPVTVSLNKVSLQQALDECFANQPLQYKIVNKNIVIQPKEEQAKIPQDDNSIPTYQTPVHGRVTDTAGKPLQNVSIVLDRKGKFESVIYTVSNEKGEFEIAAHNGDKILFSYIGYRPQTIAIGDQTEISVILEARVHELDSLSIGSVNTGYQRIKPEQSTGAVSQINTKEYESRISTNFIDGLVNKLPGLMINQNMQLNTTVNGNRYTHSLFNIRGISTMSPENQNPLIVLDGYPTELTMNMIDPNEIKSVTILKDAAAAAIYGVRASNGVIVIERKQAKAGKTQFAFRATEGITPKENYNRYKWAKDASSIVANYEQDNYVVNSGTWNSVITNTSYAQTALSPVFYIMAQSAAGVITPYQASQSYQTLKNYNNIKDYSKDFFQAPFTQTYNLDMSGGSQDALYYITGNYTGNKSEQIKNSNYSILLSGRTTIKFLKRFSLELTTDYQEKYINSVPVPDIYSIYPFEHFKDVNGNPLAITSGSGTNPWYNNYLMSLGLEDNLYYPLVDVNEVKNNAHTVNNRITANFDYTIGNGFDLMFGGIYETAHTSFNNFASEKSSVARQYINSYAVLNTDGSITFNIPKGGYLNQQSVDTSSYTLRMQLNFNRKIGKNNSINAILGAEVRDLKYKGNIATYFGYDNQTLLQQPVNYSDISSGAITGTFIRTRPLSNSSSYGNMYETLFDQIFSEDRYVSAYANIVYSFKNKYSFTSSIRIDQSNLFGTNSKYKYKPLWSTGVAWNINKEPFLENAAWIKLLKLRIADGFNGNVAKLSLPQVIAQSSLNTFTNPYTPDLELLSYANNSLRWEKTNNFNIGLDYAVFKHLSGTIDIYNKKSMDVMSNTQIDPTIGLSPSLVNNATINNKGLEISLHADWISTDKFNWNTGFVFSRNISKVEKVYQKISYTPVTLNSIGYLKGYPVGALFAYRYDGLDSLGFPKLKSTKGNVYYTEDNSSGNNTSAAISSDTSGLIKYMGSSVPTRNFGLSNRIDIGNFYFYCMINYYGGFKVFIPRPNPSSIRPLEGAGDYWKAPGDENKTDVMALGGFVNQNSNYAYNYADRYVVNGDYITLGDITASYTFDNSFFRKIGFTHFEIKLQASNIWTIGLNKYNYSAATGEYAKGYMTPTYTIAIFTNF